MQIAARALAGLCLAAIAASGPEPVQAQERPRTQSQAGAERSGHHDRRFWWKDPADQKELGLTGQQIAGIERIWASTAPSIRAADIELQALKAELDRLITQNTADESVVAVQIDRVEALRSQMNKARALMLYRMHRILSPEQYQSLTKLLERRRKDRGRGGFSK